MRPYLKMLHPIKTHNLLLFFPNDSTHLNRQALASYGNLVDAHLKIIKRILANLKIPTMYQRKYNMYYEQLQNEQNIPKFEVNIMKNLYSIRP